jgi:histidine ammonia-lyase
VLTSACERAVKLLQSPFSGLPEGLAARAGLPHDSLIEFGVAAQALTAEARLLAAPVSFELVSTIHAEGLEDRATLAPLAARRLGEMVALGERAVAIELLVACQAVDLRRARLGRGTLRAYELVRARIAFKPESEPIPCDLEPLVELVRSGALSPSTLVSASCR